MRRTNSIERRLSECLADHAALADIPGACAAISFDGQLYQAATGTLSVDTRVPATVDSVFQIGSITKMLTATLVMQLVDEGRIALDAPVRRYLPDFAVANAAVSEQVTVRQLLSHMSGIEGDRFLDTGEGPDSLALYLQRCRDLPQLHAPGEAVSYCNFGYVVLGRLIEVSRGQSWAEALRAHLSVPLEATRLLTRLDEVVKHRVAVGHVPHPTQKWPTVVERTYLPASMAPAGATAVASAGELMRFVRLHLDGGVWQGKRLLSAESVHAMSQVEGTLPGPNWVLPARGLGWVIADWSGQRVLGHDGGTTGQASFLRAAPGINLALVLLTNALTRPKALFDAVAREFFKDLGGLDVPVAPPTIGLPAHLLVNLPGRYVSEHASMVVEARAGALTLQTLEDHTGKRAAGESIRLLEPVAPRTFKLLVPDLPVPEVVAFHADDAAGVPRLLLVRNRNFRRSP